MKTVQVAIHDPVYADCLRTLLLQDRRHVVHLVETPDLSLEGVIIVDVTRLSSVPSLVHEHRRLIVMASKDTDLTPLWDAGIRHMLFYGDPLPAARTAIVGLELGLSSFRAGVG
jgi:hypothetical protein